MATDAERDAAVALHRQNINLRSVTRNDPSAVEILETSAYSTIYHYEDPDWEKQKMEGPTFIVRRDKPPQFAIYMLNRQTVKNVTIPLIPGEIKLTVVKEDMLQIARRGEKVKRAMWFSEGEDGVQRFRAKILEICGEPSKITSSAGPSSHIAGLPASPSPPPGGGGNDGFSRLFAGLIPGSAKSQEPIAGPPRSSTPTPAPKSQPATEMFPEAPIRLDDRSTNEADNSTPSTGQTADDLLMSILGMAPPPRPSSGAQAPAPKIPSAPPSNNPHPPSPAQQPSAPPASLILNSSPGLPPPPPPPVLHNHQQSPYPQQAFSAGAPPPPIPTASKPAPAPAPMNDQDFPALGKTPSRELPTSPFSYSQIAQPRSPVHNTRTNDQPFYRNMSPAFHVAQNSNMAAPPHAPNGHLPGDPMIGAIANAMAHQDLGGPARGGDDGKRLFVNTLLRRIHTEPGFVDGIWEQYLRLSRGAG